MPSELDGMTTRGKIAIPGAGGVAAAVRGRLANERRSPAIGRAASATGAAASPPLRGEGPGERSPVAAARALGQRHAEDDRLAEAQPVHLHGIATRLAHAQIRA